MRRFRVLTPAFCLLFVLAATPAFADLTGFIGVTPTPVSRPTEGFGIGTGLIIIAFEFEYATTSENLDNPTGTVAPALQTYMGNGLLQTPIPIFGMQFYATAGGGLYHETVSLDPAGNHTNVGTNIGGGAKINLAGPLRLRLDYRVFHLQGAARQPTVQRFYAGLNLKF